MASDVDTEKKTEPSSKKEISYTAWGAPVISTVIVIGFFLTFAMLLFGRPQTDAGTAAMLNILVGVLGTAFGAVVQYYFGSSAGSARKDELLANRSSNQPSAVAATGTVTVNAGDGR